MKTAPADFEMRLSRTQLLGALALLAAVWLILTFRLLFPSA
jgi:hypothetical protein